MATGAPVKENPSAESSEEKPAKKDKYPFKYTLEAGDNFSVDRMLTHGGVEATIRFNEKVSAAFRSMDVSEIQRTEALVDLTQSKEKTAKYIMNEMTISQLYLSLVSVNGKPLPPIASDGAKVDKRREFIQKLPGQMFDLLVRGLTEFDEHCKQLVGGDSLQNF